MYYKDNVTLFQNENLMNQILLQAYEFSVKYFDLPMFSAF